MRRTKTANSIVSLSGLDGCGKTTIIERVREELACRGQATRYVWLRYNHYLTKLLLGVCRLLGFTRYENHSGVRVGYHDFHRSRVISWLFIGLTFVDTFFATVLRVYMPALFGKSIVICDRWIIDILIDLQIDTGIDLTQKRLTSSAFMMLIPNFAQCFIVMRSAELVRTSREENLFDRNFEKRLRLYKAHASCSRVTVIENSGTIDSAVAKITALI
jgi:thymidylate kinase